MQYLKYVVVIVIVVNIFLALSGQREMNKKIEFESDATKEQVWKEIKGVKEYTKFGNLKITRLGGLDFDSSFKYIVQKEDEIIQTFSSKIDSITPEVSLVQKGGIPGVFLFENTIQMSKSGSKVTLVESQEEKGLLIWLQTITTWDPTLSLLDIETLKSIIQNKYPTLP